MAEKQPQELEVNELPDQSEPAPMKSKKFTGYHTFYKSVAGMIPGQIRPDGKADIGEMSKVAGTMWKQCSPQVQQDWKRRGQLMKEDMDCGIVQHVCDKCSKHFGRAKDLAYHEKQCGDCFCDNCGKKFGSGEALRRHKQSHDPSKNKCEVCSKTFATTQSLERHASKHIKAKIYTCEKCHCKYTLMSSLQRHKKKCKQ